MKVFNKNMKAILLLMSMVLFTMPTFATIYEDAEDNATTGWIVSHGNSDDVTIKNVKDTQRGSRVIELTGNERNTEYRLGNQKGRGATDYWNNITDKKIQWSMKYNESFGVLVSISTEDGNRFLVYTNQSKDTKGKIRGGKVRYGLGAGSADGDWHTFIRDLEADWNAFVPDNPIVAVNGFFIRGSGRVDDISLLSEVEPPISNHVYENAEDNTTTGWTISGDATDSTIKNVFDIERGSQVIKLTGNGKETGYRIGNRAGRASYINAWHNKTDKVLRWSMKYNEPFRIYIPITTKHGNRYLTYTNQSVDTKGKIRGGKVRYGLGEDSIDGTWHTFTRDLEADWNAFMPNDPFVAVNGFFIKGSGYIDDIMSVNDSNSNLPKVDTTKPIITLLGDATITLTVGTTYTDAGATATDDVDGNITSSIHVTGLPIDISSEGNYTVTYSVSDSAGNMADVATRNVTVEAVVNPKILTKKEPLVPSNCLGHITKSGIDTNDNGVLDDNEVTSTQEHYDKGTPITREALMVKIGNGEDVTQVNTCKITNMEGLFNGSDLDSPYPEAQRETVKSFNQDISGWNTGSVTSMQTMFADTTAFNQPIGSWDVSHVTNMIEMFGSAMAFNQPLGSWDVSHVTYMDGVFAGAFVFNQDISHWNVSNITDIDSANLDIYDNFTYDGPLEDRYNPFLAQACDYSTAITRSELLDMIANREDISGVNTCAITDMSYLFSNPYPMAEHEEEHYPKGYLNLNGWDVSNVTNMEGMFQGVGCGTGCSENWGNGDIIIIDKWDVSKVENMSYMFKDINVFIDGLENWNVSNVTNMRQMFENYYKYEQHLGGSVFSFAKWDVSNVTDMHAMFSGHSPRGLENWNVSSVRDMSFMFYDARYFNDAIGNWDVSNVTNMEVMFAGEGALDREYNTDMHFNQPIGNWNVSNVTNMYGMFSYSTAFNQDISGWDVSHVTNHEGFAEETPLEDAHNPFIK